MRRPLFFLLLTIPSLPLLAGCAGSARKDFDISSIEGTTVFESEKNFDAMTVDGRDGNGEEDSSDDNAVLVFHFDLVVLRISISVFITS